MIETNITSNNIDKGTKFNSISIVENVYDKEFEYICDYNVDMDFKNIKLEDNRVLEEYINGSIINDKRKLTKSYDKRPKFLFDDNILTKEDVKEDTVDAAFEDYLNQNIRNVGRLFNLVKSLFNYDIPAEVANNVVDKGQVELQDKKKVKRIEYNYKNSELNRIGINYEDGDYKTVELPKTVTSKTVDSVIPGESLLSLYSKQYNWLKEDYESTIELLNEIFGMNLETLKGGKVIW